MRLGVLGANMSSIVPHYSFMRRHIPIDRVNFRSLLYHSGYPNLPSQRKFLANDDLAARWYWSVFDFRRMNISRLEKVRDVRKCFDFKL
jgi:hypothetical protein